MIDVENLQISIRLQITCALSELFSVEETSVEVMNSYPRLLSAMLVRVASAAGNLPPVIVTVSRL